MKWIYPMSRYSIYVEQQHKYTSRKMLAVYGFDTGGLLGSESPIFGFFCQVFDANEEEGHEPFYWETGGKEAIIDSPVWWEIQDRNPEHAQKILLDLPF